MSVKKPTLDGHFSGLACGPGRSSDYKAGHRAALRSCVAWLQAEATTMNDPNARNVLNAAAFGLGTQARIARNRVQKDRAR
jgi:hypothetical protein